jgi:hypothetical protein
VACQSSNWANGAEIMTRYREFSLDAAALAYIRQCLELGHTLSRRLGDRDLAAGRVTTRLPAEADTSELMMFEWGRKLKPMPEIDRLVESGNGTTVRMSAVPNTNEDLSLLVQRFLRENRDNVLIIENWLARRSDPELSRRKSRVVTFEDEVYTVVCADDLQLVPRAIMESATPGVFIAALATIPLDLCGSRDNNLFSADALAACAAAAEVMIVGAYDGEAYLFWTPS